MMVSISQSLLCQSTVYVRTPIQWMDTLDYRVMAVIGESGVELYFSDGVSIVLPLPEEAGTELVRPQVSLMKDGIDLFTRRVRTIFGLDEEITDTALNQSYFISYETIKNGSKDWTLNHSNQAWNYSFDMLRLSDNKYLACIPRNGFVSSKNGQIYDWVIYAYNENNRSFTESDCGNWLDTDVSSYALDPMTERYVSRYNNLTFFANSTIVHTKNYITICNLRVGRMLVFSKETGKLARRLKLTEAVPPEQDSESVCAVPIIIVQPDMDDGIVVLARKDIDILESFEMLKEAEKYFRLGDEQEAIRIIDKFRNERKDTEWYRVDLKNGKVEKPIPYDVPYEWDHELLPPFFIPFEHGRILFGGLEKDFRELIGSVFKKPVKDG